MAFLGQVTLTTSGTAYQLYNLVKAIAPNTSPSAHQINLQGDLANSGYYVYIGNSAVTSSAYGFILTAGGSMNFEATFNGLGMDSIYLNPNHNGLLVNVIALDM